MRDRFFGLRNRTSLRTCVVSILCLGATHSAAAQAPAAPDERPLVVEAAPEDSATGPAANASPPTAAPAFPEAPAAATPATPSEVRAEPPTPPAPPAPPTPPPPAAAGDWTSWFKFYGFVEADMIYDSTESFNDVAGNAAIARKGTYAGDRARFTGGARNSRFGVKVSAPEFHGIKASGTFEMDFLGTQPAGTSEGTIFASPLFRDRHLFLKLETSAIDVVFGQTWHLFGWQSYFQSASLQITGLPGQVVSRTPQLRLSHVFKTDPVNVELAVAATRPVQRDDAGLPDGQAGLRVLINRWKGVRTVGSTGTAVDSAGIGVSGIVRRVELPELTAMPHAAKKLAAYGLSIDALLPIVPATAEDRSNALTLTGSFVTGRGIGDLYTGLTGGIPLPAPATPMGGTPIVYNATIDQGVIGLTRAGQPKVIAWQSFIIGLQYYTPIDQGRVWLALNYSNLRSPNGEDFSNDMLKTRIFDHSQFVNAALFWDATPQVRFGVDYAWYEQTYVDNVKAHNSRAQLSGFYIF